MSQCREYDQIAAFGEKDLVVEAPKGWSVSFQKKDAIIRAPKAFKGTEYITFTMLESDNDEDESPLITSETQGKSIIHTRDQSTSKATSVIFVFVFLLIIISFFFVSVK